MLHSARALLALPVLVLATAAGVAAADGGPSTVTLAAQLGEPQSVTAAGGGAFLFADTKNHRIQRISPGGTVTTVAGTGSSGSTGDGGPATAARLDEPLGVAATSDGGFLIADTKSHRIRKVSPSGTITTVAGTGSGGFSTDTPRGALSSQIKEPTGIAATADGFVFSDTGNSRVRRVADGVMTTLADADDVKDPAGIAVGPNGSVVVADPANHVVISIAGGTVTRLAGTGSGGAGADGPASSIALDAPRGVALLPGGGQLVADTKNHVIRTVIAGRSRIVAGTLKDSGSSADGPGAAGPFGEPGAAIPAGGRDILIADTKSGRIRLVRNVLPASAAATPGGLAGPTPSVSPTPAPPDGSGGSTQAPVAPGDGGGEEPPLDPAVAPVAGERVTTEVGRGAVRIRLPGSEGYVALDESASIPIGAIVDTTKGSVRLTAAKDASGGTSTAVFSHGRFKVAQTGGKHPITDLVLTGPGGACPKAGAATAAAKGTTRRLWGDGKGRFRTQGRHSAATVRGTRWLVEDRCNATLTRVVHGTVAVRDKAKRKTVVVRGGERYTARPARRPASR